MNIRIRRPLVRLATCLLAGLLVVPLAACGTSTKNAQDGKLQIVTAFYPFQFIAQRIAGDHADVSSLTAPGAEPHDLELTPKQTASIGDASLVVYQTGFQSALDEAIKQTAPKHVVDAASLVQLQPAPNTITVEDGAANEAYTKDPHEWQDPTNMEKIATAVLDQLESIDPAHKADYASGTALLLNDLKNLDGSYKTTLGTCTQKDFITTHAAFGYMAQRYGLNQIGITGLDPDQEPSPTRIAKVQQLAKQHNIGTIFYETLVSPKTAQSIAGDLGLKTDVLDPIEGVTDQSRGSDYIQIMQSNLATLKKSNNCS